jgi:pimeloyl-ACP methyl ester carboxylesterase
MGAWFFDVGGDLPVRANRVLGWLAAAGLCLAAVVLGGCTQKLSIVRVDEATLYQGDGKNVISTREPSAATKVVLREYGLGRLYWDDPDAALKALYGVWVRDGRADLLVALAELCYDQARNRPMTRTRRAEYDISCALAAYRVLIETQEAKLPVVTLERIRLARELYNRSLAWALIDPVRHLRYDVPLRVVYADCVVDLQLTENQAQQIHSATDMFAHPYELMVVGLRSRVETQGIGAPLIGMRKADAFNGDPLEAYMLAGRVCFSVTGVVEFKEASNVQRPASSVGRSLRAGESGAEGSGEEADRRLHVRLTKKEQSGEEKSGAEGSGEEPAGRQRSGPGGEKSTLTPALPLRGREQEGGVVAVKASVGGPHRSPLPKGEGAGAEHPHPSPLPKGEGVSAGRGLPKRLVGDLRLYSMIKQDTVPFGNKESVAAQVNYSVPVAIMLEDQPRLWILKGLLSPAEWESQSGLFMGHPYQKGKIPVVFVHGLASSYHIWLDMVNELRADPVLRKRYQFWLYSYFTGSPVEYSAYRFRLQMKAVHEQVERCYGADPAMEQMVIVGHSMGGLLSRTAVQQSSPEVLSLYLKRQTPGFLTEPKALSEKLSEDSRAQLARWLTYNPLKFVKRVVFIAVPHRGSAIADSMFGRTVSSMVAVPDGVMSFSGQVFEVLFDQKSAEIRAVGKRYYTGIDSLSSQDPVLRVGADQMFDQGVKLNSIVGNVYEEDKDKGRWTDMVVPYNSAHLVPAESERVVPYWHSMTDKDLVIQEMRRILLFNLVSAGKGEIQVVEESDRGQGTRDKAE